jgi:potassium-transporting ATPase KdpC subunit
MFKQLRPAIVSVLVMTVAFGLIFPLVITAIAQGVFRHQANGSLMEQHGKVIGSELIGQSFAAPGYFHPRPSAAGGGYDAAASSGTNLGPTSDKLINGIHKKLSDAKDDPGNFDGIKDLVVAYRNENGLGPNAVVPTDAVTRSASGLDPHISPANAEMQAARVALARGVNRAVVSRLVERHMEGRSLGLFGEPRVNVLKLNMALDKAVPPRRRITDVITGLR